MAAHTPGPWRAHFCERNKRFHTGRWAWFAPDPNFPGHETIVDVEKQNGAGEANARLIAAAPDLLEALKAIVVAARIDAPKNNAWQTLIADCTAAIAKATGD